MLFCLQLFMIRIFKSARTASLLNFSTAKPETYIPLRPLKDDRSLLFSVGAPSSVSLSGKILIYTPFLATALDGFINQWTNWRIFGSLCFLWAGARVTRYLHFVKAQQVFALKCNKDLSRFYVTLANNHFSNKFEEILLKRENRTFEQKFMENLKNKTLEVPDSVYQELSGASEQKLKGRIVFLKKMREGVILELPSKDIQKFQFLSQKQVRKVVRQDLLRYLVPKKSKQVLEEYTAIKDPRTFVLITTKPFKEWQDQPMHFFLNFQANREKKLQQYVRALAEGKKIVQP